ncbi:conserved hypothetical protein [Caldicellulosiruptor hydrothermalis 108]|uniref:Uncharacterized protein n=1 Tax=Caldicellulosiruptor hydrothermalis (strain DSM 18901 / VKM B-2411 / 108) TaxID=632292 RepID=E4QDT4_CALH1|nr:hypothetical protein [Caldicellulosiruptor hydrothermalis]ADQ06501.1 conserved hypothetical protein [Caldicellulosiruptor hydrothermalis 108]
MIEEFKITDSVSNRAWGDVDKSRIWQLLKEGLQEGVKGVKAAIREMYAVVKAEIDEELTQADCWGPHHEITQDGELVLNKAGLIAAAAALAGARAEPNLTPEQKRKAARHLMRHYKQLEEEPPESLKEILSSAASGEMTSLQAIVTGEININDIPVAPWANLEALKADDPEPMEVVVEIPAGKSKRGWNYTPQALQRIVGEVMSKGLPGFLGHQKPEDVETQFPEPVTHWVGAKWDPVQNKAYFRGVIDKAATNLKRWIKANVVRQVSIFGIPKLQQRPTGEVDVVDYKPLSIDWTPLNRAGMPTRIVAVGEMYSDVIDDVIERSEEKLDLKEAFVLIKSKLASKELTASQVVGEIGLDIKEFDEVAEALRVYEKIKNTFSVSGEMNVEKLIDEAAKVLAEKKKTEKEKMFEEVIKEKVAGEMAQALIKKMVKLDELETKEQIAGEIDKLLHDEEVRNVLNKIYTDRPVIVGMRQPVTNLKVKKQSI